jgi:hypothetical protein
MMARYTRKKRATLASKEGTIGRAAIGRFNHRGDNSLLCCRLAVEQLRHSGTG